MRVSGLVDSDGLRAFCAVVAISPVRVVGVDRNRIATDAVRPPHLVVEPHRARVQIRIGLIDLRMAEHLPELVQRPTRFEPTTQTPTPRRRRRPASHGRPDSRCRPGLVRRVGHLVAVNVAVKTIVPTDVEVPLTTTSYVNTCLPTALLPSTVASKWLFNASKSR
jgi:hypothetical protein